MQKSSRSSIRFTYNTLSCFTNKVPFGGTNNSSHKVGSSASVAWFKGFHIQTWNNKKNWVDLVKLEEKGNLFCLEKNSMYYKNQHNL